MYLIDSHVLIWHQNDDDRLSLKISKLVEFSLSGDLIVSTATWWELTIKESKKKLAVPGDVEGLRRDWIEAGVAESLGIRWSHLQKLRELPDIHRDPFDRILVAQALVENLIIITCDPHIPQYPGVKTLW